MKDRGNSMSLRMAGGLLAAMGSMLLAIPTWAADNVHRRPTTPSTVREREDAANRRHEIESYRAAQARALRRDVRIHRHTRPQLNMEHRRKELASWRAAEARERRYDIMAHRRLAQRRHH